MAICGFRRSVTVWRFKAEVPPWRDESASTVFRNTDTAKSGNPFAVPQLTRYLLVLLIQPFAVVCIFTDSDGVTAATSNLAKPIRVRERLPREANNVRAFYRQDIFCLLKIVNTAGNNHRC